MALADESVVGVAFFLVVVAFAFVVIIVALGAFSSSSSSSLAAPAPPPSSLSRGLSYRSCSLFFVVVVVLFFLFFFIGAKDGRRLPARDAALTAADAGRAPDAAALRPRGDRVRRVGVRGVDDAGGSDGASGGLDREPGKEG